MHESLPCSVLTNVKMPPSTMSTWRPVSYISPQRQQAQAVARSIHCSDILPSSSSWNTTGLSTAQKCPSSLQSDKSLGANERTNASNVNMKSCMTWISKVAWQINAASWWKQAEWSNSEQWIEDILLLTPGNDWKDSNAFFNDGYAITTITITTNTTIFIMQRRGKVGYDERRKANAKQWRVTYTPIDNNTLLHPSLTLCVTVPYYIKSRENDHTQTPTRCVGRGRRTTNCRVRDER